MVHVVLDGPRTLNAQTPATWAALRHAADGLPVGTRAVVLRGAGRAFSSGLDRSMFATLAALGAEDEAVVLERIAGYQQAFTCWRRPGVLGVAAVAGPAVGAGFQLALACDLRVAAADATFRMAETSLGLVPDLAGTQPLVRAVGEQAAIELCLSGRVVDAAEALRLGLVHAVVAPEELLDAVDELVAGVLAHPAASVAATLDLLRGAGSRPAAEQQERERRAQAGLLRAVSEASRPASRAAAEGSGPPAR